MSKVWGKGDYVQTIHPGAGVISGREQVGLRQPLGGAPARPPPAPRLLAGRALLLGRLDLSHAEHMPVCALGARRWHVAAHQKLAILNATRAPAPSAPAIGIQTQVIDSWRSILKGVRPRAFKITVEDVRVFAGDSSGFVTCMEVVEADDSQGRCAARRRRRLHGGHARRQAVRWWVAPCWARSGSRGTRPPPPPTRCRRHHPLYQTKPSLRAQDHRHQRV